MCIREGDAETGLTIEVAEQAPGVVLVAVSGELDIDSAAELPVHLAKLHGPDLTVVVDLSAVDFIDSSGLNAIVLAAKAVEANDASIVFAGASPHVAKVFEIVQIEQSVRTEASVSVALDDARATPRPKANGGGP